MEFLNKKNIGVIIIWPKYQYFSNKLLDELKYNNYEILKYYKINYGFKYIFNLLREIHYNKEWWETNLLNEFKKRIKNNSFLNIIIVEKKDIHLDFKKTKNSIREKLNLNKEYFHFSDQDCELHLGEKCKCELNNENFLKETNKHLHLLFHSNTIYYVKNYNYKKSYKFNIFFEQFSNWLKENKYNSDKFCIDNGGVLSAYGLRDAHDLDYLSIDNIESNHKNYGCENKNHKLEYENMGLSINDIILNPDNYFYHFNIKFLNINILEKFKYNRTKNIGQGQKEIRNKDINDYNLIKSLINF
jgi:hypothetical protein